MRTVVADTCSTCRNFAEATASPTQDSRGDCRLNPTSIPVSRRHWCRSWTQMDLVDSIHQKSSYIVFTDGPPSLSGKTRTWTVHNYTGRFMGVVKWWTAWRCYCYFPEQNMVFEKTCLRDIATFVEDRTREHKK